MIEGVVWWKKPEEDTRSRSWSVQGVWSEMFEPLDQNLLKCSEEVMNTEHYELHSFSASLVWLMTTNKTVKLFILSRCRRAAETRGSPGGLTAGGCSASDIRAAVLLFLQREARQECTAGGAGGRGGGGSLYLEDWLHAAPVIHQSARRSRLRGTNLQEENLLKLVFSTNLQTELWRLFIGSSLNHTAHMSSVTWSPAFLQLILKEQFTLGWKSTPHVLPAWPVKWWHGSCSPEAFRDWLLLSSQTC